MKARYQYRVYPTDQQRKSLAQVFGCVRVVFNDALALCNKSENLPKNSELQKICITQAKKTEERQWLSEVSNIPLQQSVADLGVAYKNFFDSLSGKRQGRRVGYPRFKKKHNQQSARFRKGGFSIKQNKVYLAKIGLLKVKWSRKLPSEPSSVTIIKDRANLYFLSFVVDVEPSVIPAKNESLGIDLGVSIFATLSSGQKVYAPDYSKLERKIRRVKRILSRRNKGGNRREQTRIKLAKLTSKLARVRKDFLDKLSTRLVVENQIISLEDLAVSGMVKNHRLARAISQQGWRMFRNMCEAKANKYCRDIRIINRWQPTSQICADCGYKWGKLDLSIREIACLGCNSRKCRDGNASKVIDRIGVGHIHDGRRGTWSGFPTVSASKKWTGSGHKTSTEAIHDELSTRLVVDENGQFCLPI
ncbi:transposase [Pleurocapsales cyanobacterium LEGE 10410]|nr:transposase [Pleurocapsales cyanobacterium LEGE 10410]